MTGNDLSLVAVLDRGHREAMMLISENALGQQLHQDLRARVITAGYTLALERLADVGLIAEVNRAINREGAETMASDVRPIVEELVRDAIVDQATDIHLCCREGSGMALFRVHSRMYPYRNYDVATCEQIAGYLYTQMADSRTRSIGTFSLDSKSMSCMVRTTHNGTHYKLRYKFIRLADGWDVIIRVLAVETAGMPSKTFEELGYAFSQVQQLELSAARSIGLIAITGPTGSGKSTTVKAAMEFDPNRRFRKRYSVEDPVEYKIFMVSQISIQRSDHEEEDDSNAALLGTLRDILRADPDEVLVGETRDRATASIVGDFVLTGHKLYTTLHTSSAFGALLRLNRLGLDRHILADRQFISAVAFQRLLPIVCPHCSLPANQVLPVSKLKVLQGRFGISTDAVRCSSEDGCSKCRHRGVIGSTVVAEIVTPDKIIRQFIAEGRDEQAEDYWRKSRRAGYDEADMTGKTAYEHALYKVSQGLIDPRDLEREFEPLEGYELVEASQ
ncbi:Flp pilus assembly complex ATPase component TadA [Pseudomonas syringae]|nr:Flp pilus assembly complex ATPase component TadA [Pseudomonas syringae]